MDVGLGHLRHGDRGLHSHRLVLGLERILERERVDHRGEHAHVVGAGAIHASLGAAEPAEDVAAPDDHRDLHAEVRARVGDLVGDALHHGGVDPEADARIRERLAGELQHHSAVLALGHVGPPSSRASAVRGQSTGPFRATGRRSYAAPRRGQRAGAAMGRVAPRRVIATCLVMATGAALLGVVGPTPAVAATRWDPRVEPIAREVEHIRHLRFTRPVQVQFMKPASFERLLRRSGDPRTNDVRARRNDDISKRLQALGLVPPGTHFGDASGDELGAGLLGFFNGRFVVVKGKKITAFVEVVLAHELTHALQSQHFQVPRIKDAVAAQAFTSLREGEAEWVAGQYYRGMPEARRRAYDELSAAVGMEVQQRFDDSEVPAFLTAASGAPYQFGTLFATATVATGGVRTLDDLWDDPPSHDAGILNLLRDPQARVRTVPAPRDRHKASAPFRTGATSLYQLLATRIDPYQALQAADEWNGDNGVRVTTRHDVCVRMVFSARDDTGAAVLGAALRDWADAKGDATVTGDNPIELDSCRGDGAAPVSFERVQLITLMSSLRQAIVVHSLERDADATTTTCVVDSFLGDSRLVAAVTALDPTVTKPPPELAALTEELRQRRDHAVRLRPRPDRRRVNRLSPRVPGCLRSAPGYPAPPFDGRYDSSPILTRAKRRTVASVPRPSSSLPTVVLASRTKACSSSTFSL